jgi:hypothetical protein
MPRASWRGFLRLSLVTCPVYLSPATTHTSWERRLTQQTGRRVRYRDDATAHLSLLSVHSKQVADQRLPTPGIDAGGNPPSAIPNGLPEADQKPADDIRQGL